VILLAYELVIRGEKSRARAILAVSRARLGARVRLEEPLRTLPQNRLFHTLVGEIAVQKKIAGKLRSPAVWKVLFLQACGHEVVEWIPALDGETVIPFGYRSSRLGKEQMSDLIEFIFAWGASNGVKFDAKEARAA
jgi:NinB protein